MLDRFQITMKLVEAGCDLRKLDPEIISIIEKVGQDDTSAKKPSNIYNTYPKIAVAAATHKRNNTIKRSSETLFNNGSDGYQKLAAAICYINSRIMMRK